MVTEKTMHYVYVLQSEKDKKLYVGVTGSIEKRLEEHNAGKNFSTKSRRPFKVLFYEALPTSEEAIERERFYKSGRGHEVLYKILFKTLRR